LVKSANRETPRAWRVALVESAAEILPEEHKV
jgi:hypothetical protein